MKKETKPCPKCKVGTMEPKSWIDEFNGKKKRQHWCSNKECEHFEFVEVRET